MNLNKQDKEYKDYLKLCKQRDQLWDKIHRAPKVAVEPFQKGWMIVFELRDDIKRRSDAATIEKVKNFFYKSFWTNNVKLVRLIRSIKNFDDILSKKEFHGHHYTNSYSKQFNVQEYNSFPESEKKYIRADYFEKTYKPNVYWYKASFPHWYLVLKTKPYIVTHLPQVDGSVISEHDKLEARLRPLYNKYGTNYSRTYPSNSVRTEIRGKIQQFKKNEIEAEDIRADVFCDYYY